MIYILTGENTLKVKNIRKNNKIAVTIPLWKNFFHKIIPAPPAKVHFRAKAEIIPYENEKAKKVYKKFRHKQSTEIEQESIWIKIIPSSKIVTYGVGVKLLDMRKPEKALKIIELQ